MKLALLKDENQRQALYIKINERKEGGAYVIFEETNTAMDVATKLHELAETIETAANG